MWYASSCRIVSYFFMYTLRESLVCNSTDHRTTIKKPVYLKRFSASFIRPCNTHHLNCILSLGQRKFTAAEYALMDMKSGKIQTMPSDISHCNWSMTCEGQWNVTCTVSYILHSMIEALRSQDVRSYFKMQIHTIKCQVEYDLEQFDYIMVVIWRCK